MAVSIILESENALQDWFDSAEGLIQLQDGQHPMRAVYVSKGTASGMPAVLLAGIENDTLVVFEMTARMFNAIAAAFRGRADYEGTPL